jgi:hypothetical protein
MDGPSETIAPPVYKQPIAQNNLVDSFNFNNNSNPPQQNNNDVFGLLDINIGSQPPAVSTGGFGGDLLGFGMETSNQPAQLQSS